MLLYNLNTFTSISFILSHPYLNKIIQYPFKFQDDELIAFYINFVKGILARMDENNIQLFYNRKFSTFPLLLKIIGYYNHKDNLVRTSVRNAILGITKSKLFFLNYQFSNVNFAIILKIFRSHSFISNLVIISKTNFKSLIKA